MLFLSLSGSLTNVRDSINLAQLELTQRFPGARAYPVDTLCATAGIGLLAERAIMNRSAGMSVSANARNLNEKRHQVCHLFFVEDLMHLKRGGRIPASAAVVGTALHVKPILAIDESGALRVIDKKRGKKHAAEDLLARYDRSRSQEDHRVAIVHGDAPDLAAQLAEGVLALDPAAQITTGLLCPIIGAHTGPGMAALVYFGYRFAI